MNGTGMRWIWTLSRLRKRKMREWSPVPLPPSGLNIPMPPCKPPRSDEFGEIARGMAPLMEATSMTAKEATTRILAMFDDTGRQVIRGPEDGRSDERVE